MYHTSLCSKGFLPPTLIVPATVHTCLAVRMFGEVSMSMVTSDAKLKWSLMPLLCMTLWPLITVGCDAGGPDASGPLVTESAGILIVENEAQLWPSGGGWRIEVEPSLTIGQAGRARGPASFSSWPE
jgi:hypothetical protein